MKRQTVTLAELADWHRLCAAAQRAARGKRDRSAVQQYFANFEANTSVLRHALLDGQLPCGQFRAFVIRDPKRRVIHAAPFADRVAHHALIACIGEPLDRWQPDTSYACREGKGVHAAVAFAQRQSRRWPVYLKLDISGYFEHIDHAILRELLACRLKGEGVFRLIDSVLASHHTVAGKGLPIGALSSQHFSNCYLVPADRWAIAQPQTAAHCRYMDDTVLWCRSLADARNLAKGYSAFVSDRLQLQIKTPVIQHSTQGLGFCGVRVFAHRLLASRRRLRRYKSRLFHWESMWVHGELSDGQLQRNADAVLASLLPVQSLKWRQRQLTGRPPLEIV